MNLQEIKYDAFISYRHCELDQFVAITLHKELEAFKLPKVIARQLEAKGNTKKKIERVFRDRDELPITNNLADPITNALRNSEFLLVICSPRLKESLWCRKEIETFISMHGREKVFAVLIEGEPADSFPEELLYAEKLITDEDGVEHIIKEPVEPLAADVRGKTKSEIRKKIKEEILRLAAPMFDCSYDDLKQRHRERAIRRIIATAGTVSAVFGAFGVISSVMAYQINEQSIQIKEQSVQIQAQADQITQQYQEALRTNAGQLSEDAFALIEKGDLDAAVDTAYYALTGSLTDRMSENASKNGNEVFNEIEEMPYTAEAEYALATALNVYRNGRHIAPTRLLTQESQVNFCHTSPDMSKIMIVDIFGNLTIYNPLTGEELWQTYIGDTYMPEDGVCFIDNDRIAYPVEDGFAVYNMSTKEESVVDNAGQSAYLLQADKQGKYLLAMDYTGAKLYDTEAFQSAFSLDNEDMSFSYAAEFSRQSGDIVVVEDKFEETAGIQIINIPQKTVTSFITEHDSITSMWVEDEYIYLTAYTGVEETLGAVYCVKTDGTEVWRYELSGMPDHILSFGAGEADKLSFEVYSKLCVISKEDGSFICETDCGREITNYAAYVDSDQLTYMSREGEFHFYQTNSNDDLVFIDKFLTNSDNLKEFEYGNGYYASVAHQDNAVAIYETAIGKELEWLLDIEETPLQMKLSKDEKYLVCNISDGDYATLFVIDLNKLEILHEIVTDSHILDFAITDDNEIMVLHMDSVSGYDIADGTQIFIRETETMNEYFLRNGGAYVGSELQEFYMCDTATGETLYKLEDNYLLQDGMLVSDIDDEGKWYAYADEEKKGITLGSFENGDVRTIDVNIKAVKAISLAMQEQAVYLTYLDETVDVYNINTGEFVRRYENVPEGVEDILELPDINKTLLLTVGDAYLLNEDKEVIAFIEGFECYKSSKDSFVLSNYGNIYEVPRYEVEELKALVQ